MTVFLSHHQLGWCGMNDIPDDIIAKAREHIAQGEMAIVTVVNAILAERERCAELVEHRLTLAKYLAPEAASALFAALPDAILNPHSLPPTPPAADKPEATKLLPVASGHQSQVQP